MWLYPTGSTKVFGPRRILFIVTRVVINVVRYVLWTAEVVRLPIDKSEKVRVEFDESSSANRWRKSLNFGQSLNSHIVYDGPKSDATWPEMCLQ